MSQGTSQSVDRKVTKARSPMVRVLPQGMVNVFLLDGSGTGDNGKGTVDGAGEGTAEGGGLVLVDAGLRGGGTRILRTLRAMGVDPKRIRLIIATHNHEDHIGALQALREATGAKTAMSAIDRDVMEGRRKEEITPLTLLTKVMFRLSGVETKPAGHGDRQVSATPPKPPSPPKHPTPPIDMVMEGAFDLRPYGIAGDVLPTPGHTQGSVSILLEDGSALIGDSLMAMMPWSKPGKPMLAHDLDLIRTSMRMLLDRGATRFYLSHGKAFAREDIETALRNL